jgi:hypothetical protein
MKNEELKLKLENNNNNKKDINENNEVNNSIIQDSNL